MSEIVIKHDVNQKKNHGKEKDPSSLSETRTQSKGDGKGEIKKGKDPKAPVRQENRINGSALISRRSNAKRNPLATRY